MEERLAEALRRFVRMSKEGMRRKGPVQGHVVIGRWDADEALFHARAVLKEWDEREAAGTVYYVAQERAMAPGIVTDWPAVIKHPTNKNGRLVKLPVREQQQ